MTRKRFVKLLMSEGYSRNEANDMAGAALEGYSYEVSYIIHSALRQMPDDFLADMVSTVRSSVEKLATAIMEVIPPMLDAIIKATNAAIEAIQKTMQETSHE